MKAWCDNLDVLVTRLSYAGAAVLVWFLLGLIYVEVR